MIPSPPPRQVWSIPALLSLLVLACGTPPPPDTKPDLPQVTVRLDETSIVARSFKLTIAVSGCDQVQRLELYNDTTLVKQVSYVGATTPVTVNSEELKYQQGLATPLSLSARVTCADGRTNVSQGQSATFFPVAEVIDPPDETSQIVPDYFIAEGSGENVAFIGCALQGARSYLYKVSKSNPGTPQRLEMTFPCDETTVITDRKPANTGVRWVYTPGKGMLALKSNFTVAYSTRLIESLQSVVVTPDGDVLVSGPNYIGRVSGVDGVLKWRWDGMQLPIAGDPIVRAGTTPKTVVVPLQNVRANDTSDIAVVVLDYNAGPDAPINYYAIDNINSPQTATFAFNDTGTVLYLGQQLPNGVISVRACAVGQSKPCLATYPQSRLWINDTLPGYLAALVPYANNQRLAVIASNRFWFLDVGTTSANKGLVINKDQQALTPAGALVGRFAQPGKGDAFFMFNSAPGSTGATTPHPVEVLATEAAEKGSLYSYQMPGGLNLFGAVDDSGTLWLRVGRKLVRTLSLTEYRNLR